MDRNGNLNDQERSTLRLMYQGLGNKEIAVRLDANARTVKWWVSHILNKYGVATREELLAKRIAELESELERLHEEAARRRGPDFLEECA